MATPDCPGGTRHFEFAQRLALSGVIVTLVTADLNLSTRSYRRRESSADRSAKVESIDGVSVRWLYASPYSANNWRRAYSMLRFSASVFVDLMRVKTDSSTLFLGSSPHLFGALATLAAARLRRVRFSLEVRDLWPETLIGMTGRVGVGARLMRVIADALYANSEAIIVLAENSRQAIASRGIPPGRVIFVPNSIDPAAFGVPAAEDGSDWPFAVADFVAVYAGAHGPANGLETVLEACKILQAQGEDGVKVLLVGDGPSRQELMGLAERYGLRNVVFRSPVPKSSIPALLSRCGAGLLTLRDVPVFRYGVSPNKLFDYMAAGLPVVTNVQGDVAAIVADAECGLVAEPDDAGSLATALMTVRGCQDAQAMGERGRCHVLEHYNRDTLVGRLSTVFENGGDGRSRGAASRL